MSTMAPDESTAATASVTPRDRRRRLMVVPLALLCALGLVLGYLFLNARPEPGVPLGWGSSAVVPGGTARIKGIVPLEDDGWLPPEHVQVLEEGPSAGTHRVRVLVQFTAVEAGGILLDTSGFVVSGLAVATCGRCGRPWRRRRSARVSRWMPPWSSNFRTRPLPWS